MNEELLHSIRCLVDARVPSKTLITARKWATDPESHMQKFYQNFGYLGTEVYSYEILIREVEGVLQLNSPRVDANREELITLYKTAMNLREIVVGVNQIIEAMRTLKSKNVNERDIVSIVKNLLYSL